MNKENQKDGLKENEVFLLYHPFWDVIGEDGKYDRGSLIIVIHEPVAKINAKYFDLLEFPEGEHTLSVAYEAGGYNAGFREWSNFHHIKKNFEGGKIYTVRGVISNNFIGKDHVKFDVIELDPTYGSFLNENGEISLNKLTESGNQYQLDNFYATYSLKSDIFSSFEKRNDNKIFVPWKFIRTLYDIPLDIPAGQKKDIEPSLQVPGDKLYPYDYLHP